MAEKAYGQFYEMCNALADIEPALLKNQGFLCTFRLCRGYGCIPHRRRT